MPKSIKATASFPKGIDCELPTGVMIRDSISAARRRWPVADSLLAPALVQGENAAGRQRHWSFWWRRATDSIILARGGGSLEDCGLSGGQWSSNLCLPLPVVSAVGHETDFTIADFVADPRAPTPSAAQSWCCRIFPPSKDSCGLLLAPGIRSGSRGAFSEKDWQRLLLLGFSSQGRACGPTPDPAR